jgi:uncharacterized protein (DUF1778 family)
MMTPFIRENSERTTLRTTPQLRSALIRAAEAKGMTVGAWLRSAALAALTKEGISL